MSHNFSASAPVFIPNGVNPAPFPFSPSSNNPFEASPDAYSFFGIHPIEGGPKILDQQLRTAEELPKKILTFRDLEKMMGEERTESRRQKSVSPNSRLTRRDLERMQREEEDDEEYYQEYQRKHLGKSQFPKYGSPGFSNSPVQITPMYHRSPYNSGVTVGPVSVQQLMTTFRGYR